MGPPKFQSKALGRPVAASASGFSGLRPPISPLLNRAMTPGGTSTRPGSNVAPPRLHWPPPFVSKTNRGQQPIGANPGSSRVQAKPNPQFASPAYSVPGTRNPQLTGEHRLQPSAFPIAPGQLSTGPRGSSSAHGTRVQILPHQARPGSGTVQRMRGIDLIAASAGALEMVGVKAATEVQTMHVDGSAAMTANTPTALAALKDAQVEELSRLLSPSHAPAIGAAKAADSYSTCATKLAVKDRSLIILNKGDGAYHAEQRLLLVLAQMLKSNSVPNTIHIYGAKPPCGTCKAVLTAFNNALDAIYDKVIIFSNQAGQDRDRASIETDPLFTVGDSDESKFAKFARKFRENLN